MKAKEYYDKYLKEFENIPPDKLLERRGEMLGKIKELFLALSDEIFVIKEARGGSSTDSVMAAILKEQGDKWNCIARRWCPYIGYGDFIKYWKDEIPLEVSENKAIAGYLKNN